MEVTGIKSGQFLPLRLLAFELVVPQLGKGKLKLCEFDLYSWSNISIFFLVFLLLMVHELIFIIFPSLHLSF